jgi:hypothetical protein
MYRLARNKKEVESKTNLEMDTMVLEANREMSEAIVEHQEVLGEEAAVETIGALEDRHGVWCLAIRCHGRLTRNAVPARCKGHRRKGLTVEKR